MPGVKDTELIKQLANMIEATESPAVVTTDPDFQPGVRKGRERSIAAKNELERAAKAADDDTTENKAVALAFADALAACVGELAFLSGELKNRLLNVRPEQKQTVGAVELSNRRRFLATVIDTPPSRIAGSGRVAATTKLRTIANGMAQAGGYVKPEELAVYEARVVEVEQASVAVAAEALDDTPIYNELVAARVEAMLCRVAFRELLSAVLRFGSSELDVDEFLLRARTRAARPAAGTETPAKPGETEPVVT